MSNIVSKIGSAVAANIASRAGNSIGNKVMSETKIHLEQYSSEAKALISAAQSYADECRSKTTEILHLLAKVLEQKEILVILNKMGVPADALAIATKSALDGLPKNENGVAYLSSSMHDLMTDAQREANKQDGIVGLGDLLNAMVNQIRGPHAKVLQQFNLVPGSFRMYEAELKKTTLQSTATMNNSSFTNDLVARARNGEFGLCIGRDSEVRRLLQVLSRSTKNNPLLMGEAGTGKTTIVRAIATRLANHEVPANLDQISFIELELNALMSGTRSRADVEEKIKTVIQGFNRDGQKFIMVIEGIDHLLGANPMANLTDLFKMLLDREEVQIFGTTTPEGLRKINEKDPALVRRFTILNVEAPNADAAVEMLRGMAGRFEKHHNVVISDAAIRSAVSLAKRYVQDKALPDSAIDLLDEASARKRVEMTGIPADLDRDIQRLSSLRAQQNKLINESDPMGVRALEKISSEMLELEPRVSEWKEKLERRRNIKDTRVVVREEYQKHQKEMEECIATGNFARVGELEHVVLPALKEKLEKMEAYFEKVEMESVGNVVGEAEIAIVVAETTGIPVAKMMEDEVQKLLQLESRLEKIVVGQGEAVSAVSKSIRRSRVGLRAEGKPIGSFLFLGASGVGKTQLAKALAELLFDDEHAMTRFDCSEMQEKHHIARLLGSPVGYEGSSEGGALVRAIQQKPYSVILFDEIEKAHADIFNILLAVLDDGHISDARNNTADCSNTIIIMTSNLGSQKILGADERMFETAEGREEMNEILQEEVRKFFRPEFINRIDDVIAFRPLNKTDLRGIVDIELKKVEQLMSQRELKLKLSDRAKMALVEINYEAAFGARPLKRAILKKIQDPLAQTLLTNGAKQGDTIQVDVNEDQQFIFT